MNYLALIVLIFCTAQCLCTTESLKRRILFFFPIGTYSHRISVWPLVAYLADEGHDVTFLSTFPSKHPHPKVTEIVPEELVSLFGDIDEANTVLENRRQSPRTQDYDSWDCLVDFGLNSCRRFVEGETVQTWINNSQEFDYVVVNGLYSDCGFGIAYKFGRARTLIYATADPGPWQLDSFALPPETNWIPDNQFHYSLDMNFWERLWTAQNALSWHLHREYSYLPRITHILRDGLGIPDMPTASELEKNVSLVFMNYHYSEEFARSLPPFVIPVGGIHIKEKTIPVPKNFEDFIASAGDKGFVYISFGSFLNISTAPPEIREAFLGAIRRVDVNFIWRWDGAAPESLPKNVFLSKWIPQQDLLAHPKIRAFISHSGLLGITEAMHYGVPLIVMPAFADQDYNADRVHARGHGIKLEISTVTENELVDALDKVLTDPSYKSQMSKKSKEFRDRPIKPRDLAIWWMEFLFRHEDTSFMVPGGIRQNWFLRRSLDVYGLASVILLGAILLLTKITASIIKLVSQRLLTPLKKVKTK